MNTPRKLSSISSINFSNVQLFFDFAKAYLVKYAQFVVAILCCLYLIASRSQGNSNVQYYVSWTQEILSQQLLDSYHIQDGRSISSEIGELVVPYTPLTLYFFYFSARFVFIFTKDSFYNYVLAVNLVAVFSTFLIAFLVAKIRNYSRLNSGLIFLMTPTVIIFSPILGFQDTLMTFFLILGIYFVQRQKYLLAGCFLACSVWTKQLALMPVVSVFLLFLFLKNWKVLINLSLSALVTTLVVLFPFIITGSLRAYLESQALTSVHTMLSAQATNFPYLTSLILRIKEFGWSRGFNLGGYGLRIESNMIRQTVYIGFGLLTIFIFVFWLIKYLRFSQSETPDLWLIASFMIFTYYIFNAGVHENHAFAALPMFLLINNREKSLRLYLIFSSGLGLHLLVTSGLGSSFPEITKVLTLSGSSATIISLVIMLSYLYCYRLLWAQGLRTGI